MFAKGLVGGLMAMAMAVAWPAAAQVPNPSPTRELPYDRGYDKETPRGDAINAEEAPVTRALNAGAATDATAVVAQNADAQAQYQVDMDRYRAQVMASHRDAMRDQRRYDRQQRAYADAMSAWRAQSAACERGHMSACALPTPDPADYY